MGETPLIIRIVPCNERNDVVQTVFMTSKATPVKGAVKHRPSICGCSIMESNATQTHTYLKGFICDLQ
jgi:hypothetical protein